MIRPSSPGAASPAPSQSFCAGKAWILHNADEVRSRRLATDLGLPEPIARALLNRHITDAESAARFLEPRLSASRNPGRIPGMETAVARIWRGIESGERILVFGDYDVDGIASTALMIRVLRGLGATVNAYIPHRMEHGYGLTCAALEDAAEQHPFTLLITVDCGTGSPETVEQARSWGIDVIVTDHHEPPPNPALALALLNPKAAGDAEDQVLAGVGVAFKLSHALIKAGRSAGKPAAMAFDLRHYLYLAALGTVADMVPLMGESRLLASCGLEQMNREMPAPIAALCQVSGIREPLTSYHIGFLIGPRINAAGRMESPETALQLLLCDSLGEAMPLADELQAANEERKQIESGIEAMAIEQVSADFDPSRVFAIVAAGEGWHPGVVGIVASRLVGKFHRPAIVIGINEEGRGKGSCRSIEGFDLVGNLAVLSDMLIRHGGHPMAAGMEIMRHLIPEFRERFNGIAMDLLAGKDLRPVLKLDDWLTPSFIGQDLMTHISRMKPFGLGNPSPVWGCRDLRVDRCAVVGKRHLKMRLSSAQGQVFDAIAFGFAERELPSGRVDVAFQLRQNHFGGQTSLQMQIEDIRSAE